MTTIMNNNKLAPYIQSLSEKIDNAADRITALNEERDHLVNTNAPRSTGEAKSFVQRWQTWEKNDAVAKTYHQTLRDARDDLFRLSLKK